MKYLKPILFILLLLLITSCGIFKNRTVKTITKDSIVAVVKHDTLRKTVKSIDTTLKVITKVNKAQDSTITEVDITPVSGVPFSLDSGKFVGRASKVVVITRNHKNSSDSSHFSLRKGIGVDSSISKGSSESQTTSVKDKNKLVVSTPNYTWIIYVVAIILVLAGIVFLYYKYVLKKTVPLP